MTHFSECIPIIKQHGQKFIRIEMDGPEAPVYPILVDNAQLFYNDVVSTYILTSLKSSSCQK